jgi:protein with PEP-CTERM/exosortase system signal
MKTFLLTLCSLLACASTYASTFSDADYFGSTNSNGNPKGVLLIAGIDAVNSSFNFVSPDRTAGFTIGAPYDSSVQGTYTSQLGYGPGTTIDPTSLFFTFFFRDALGGGEAERINIGFNDLVFNNGSFTGTLVTELGGNAALVGNIESDGFVNYRIRAISGEFIFDAAYARFNTPDGGSTVALLGFSLAAVGVLRRRFAR